MSFCVYMCVVGVEYWRYWLSLQTTQESREKEKKQHNNHGAWWRLITIALSKIVSGVRSKYLTIISMVHHGWMQKLIAEIVAPKLKCVSVCVCSFFSYLCRPTHTQWQLILIFTLTNRKQSSEWVGFFFLEREKKAAKNMGKSNTKILPLKSNLYLFIAHIRSLWCNTCDFLFLFLESA